MYFYCSLLQELKKKGYYVEEDVESYKQKLVEYERIFGFKPECYEVKPVAGVHIL